MAIHSNALAWRTPWTEDPWGSRELDTTERLTFSLSLALSSCVTIGLSILIKEDMKE